MTEKTKYQELMRRYFEAETTPDEERDLAGYAAASDDPDFEVLRGVFGFVSIGRVGKARSASAGRSGRVGIYAAVSMAAAVAAILFLRHPDSKSVQYMFSEKTTDEVRIMQSVEASLSEFFSRKSDVPLQLSEIFDR